MNGGDAAGVPEWPLPFLRRYDPDQVQGSGSPPSQHRQVRPSAGLNAMERGRGCQLLEFSERDRRLDAEVGGIQGAQQRKRPLLP